MTSLALAQNSSKGGFGPNLAQNSPNFHQQWGWFCWTHCVSILMWDLFFKIRAKRSKKTLSLVEQASHRDQSVGPIAIWLDTWFEILNPHYCAADTSCVDTFSLAAWMIYQVFGNYIVLGCLIPWDFWDKKGSQEFFKIWLDMECPRHSHTSCICSSTNNKFSVRAPSPWNWKLLDLFWLV